MSTDPVSIAIVGAGHRSVAYAEYALEHPERMRVVAVADPDPGRRNALAERHGIPPERQLASYEGLVRGERMADAVINGTMDRLHYRSSLPLIERGYHMLLEKPIASTESEVRELVDAAHTHDVTVMICHVLRYAPFYVALQEALSAGEIGELIALHTSENVSYHHMAVGFIRGRWNNSERSNPMILAKCCHDLDIIAWLLSSVQPRRVASFGSLKQFTRANAPAGSTDRCLGGCAIEPTCPYSARANYIDQGLWGFYAFEGIEHLRDSTLEQKLESLRLDNPYGRCVWRCDNDVVDHQSVIIEFANGVTASHDMFCATSRSSRTIHLVGSKGEIEGDLESGRLVVKHPARTPSGFFERQIQLNTTGDSHGGGDLRLVEDFVSVLRKEPVSRATTRIEDSLNGHLLAFAAERARLEGRVIEIPHCRPPIGSISNG